MDLSKIKCFSMTYAPNVVAKEVWNPAIMSLKNLDDSDIDT